MDETFIAKIRQYLAIVPAVGIYASRAVPDSGTCGGPCGTQGRGTKRELWQTEATARHGRDSIRGGMMPDVQ
jgi:hypothetical protein